MVNKWFAIFAQGTFYSMKINGLLTSSEALAGPWRAAG